MDRFVLHYHLDSIYGPVERERFTTYVGAIGYVQAVEPVWFELYELRGGKLTLLRDTDETHVNMEDAE